MRGAVGLHLHVEVELGLAAEALEGVAHQWQSIAHPCQAHHQTERLPIHKIAGGALKDPVKFSGCSIQRVPPIQSQRLEGSAFFSACIRASRAISSSLRCSRRRKPSRFFTNLAPALTAIGGVAALGQIEHRVGSGCLRLDGAETGDRFRSGFHRIWSERHLLCVVCLLSKP